MTTNSEIATAVAGGGWLGSYLEYAKSLTRAPAMYHIATGLTCLAVSCGSKVSWRDFGDKETWPNLYCIVLGTTGLGKTTSTNIGTDLLRRSIPDSVIADDFTPEAMVRELAAHPASLVYSEEFGTLLAASSKEYNSGMKEILTALYDPRQEFKRSRSGKDGVVVTTVYRPALSMLAGSTIDWLIHHLNEVDFQSGFMPRMLLFPQDDTDLEPEPEQTMFGHRDDHLYAALRTPLFKLGVMRQATVIFDEHSVKYRRAWTDAQQGDVIIASNENMRGMVQRVSSTVFKIAALLAVADYGAQERYVVTLPTVKRAAMLVGWLVKHSVDLFDRHILFEKFEKDAQLLLDWVPDAGIQRTELLRYARRPVSEFNRMMDTLIQRGDIEKIVKPVEGTARHVDWYRRIYRQSYQLPLATTVIDTEDPIEEQEAFDVAG